MIKRGGGTVAVRSRILSFHNKDLPLAEQVLATKNPHTLVVEVLINVCDSMGANLVNTVCEGIAP